MLVYRTVLVWLLRLLAIWQIALGAMLLTSMVNFIGSDQISGPITVQPGTAIEQAIATFLGPVVCLAIAEVLALLNSRKAGHTQ